MPFTFDNKFNSNERSNIRSIDSSIISKLNDSGIILANAGITTNQLLTMSQPTRVELIPGALVPVYQSSSGQMYLVDEKLVVYTIVAKSNAPGITPPAGGGETGGPIFPPSNPIIPTPGPLPSPTPTPLPPSQGGSGLGSGEVFINFEPGDIVPNQHKTVTRAMWSNNVGNLLNFHTSSAQTTAQKRYYYEIFNSASSNTNCTAEAQFSVAYGHKLGSGSSDEGGQVDDTPAKAIYGQYRLLCLDPGVERFIIAGQATDSIYAINVNRARFREQIDPGNFEINLHHLSGSEWLDGGETVDTHTGSNVTLGASQALRLIDDSKTQAATITSAGEVYNIVSGSIEDGIYNPTNPQKFGLLYPRLGVAILDGGLLDRSASFLTVTGSEVAGDNAYKLYSSMSGSAANLTDASGDILGFQARSSENVKSTHYFVRLKNSQLNFSNNPTFVTGSQGDLRYAEFIGNPQVFVTTIGLYNSRNELLAVAKLSKPTPKNFTSEIGYEIKLDY